MMKNQKATQIILLTLITVMAGVAGCKKRDTGLTPIPGGTRGQVGDASPQEPIDYLPSNDLGPGNIESQNLPGSSEGAMAYSPNASPDDYANLTEDPDYFSENTVYFDFDSSAINFDQEGKIRDVAEYLKANPLQKLRLEGHCDERGTEQYNLSLGDRRAASVREFLVNLGIAADRIEAISWGEERPVCTEKTESCYALNRRVEFILLKPGESP